MQLTYIYILSAAILALLTTTVSAYETVGQVLAPYFPGKPYAWNIWTMYSDHNRLYLGGGNSSNQEPNPNAGPVPVIYIDLESGQLVNEGWLPEEQIDRFVVLDKEMWIPGHDPRQNWEWGNIYHRNANGRWEQIRKLPGVLHAYDMQIFGEHYYIAGSTQHGAALIRAEHPRDQWKVTVLGKGRGHALLPINGNLYWVKEAFSSNEDITYEINSHGIGQWRQDLTPQVFFGDTKLPPKGSIKISRYLKYGEQIYFIFSERLNDHQSKPLGLSRITSLAKGEININQITLPENYRPYNIIEADGTIYVLANKSNTTNYKAAVFKIEKTEVIRKIYEGSFSGFANSFSIANNNLYLAIGCSGHDVLNNKTENCGKLIMVKSKEFR